ncbi:hypothetical protein, partial [Streptomyces hydrogenans]|uniref:hypothetical protein n=1 Tax=Streptomyces hydrogenans TaxID=1873719 RepID=UPI003666B3D8
VRDLAESITTSAISDFLKGSDWILTGRRAGQLEFWLPPPSPSRTGADTPFVLPLDDRTPDHTLLVRELLVRLAGYFGDDPHGLLQRVKAARWDTLTLRMRGNGNGVCLEDATCLLKTGTKMLRLSALYTDNPYRMAWGSRRSAPVTEYLRDGVRLGRAERGEFAFPVLSRVWHSEAEAPAFGRHVMTNLADSLERIQKDPAQDAEVGNETQLFDAAIAKCLGALPRVENVAMSFHWCPDPALSTPTAARESFTFDASRLRLITEGPTGKATTNPGRSTATSLPPRQAHAAPSSPPALRRSPQRFTGRITAIGVNHHTLRPGQSPYFLVLQSREGEFFLSASPEDYSFALRARRAGRSVSAIGTCSIHAGKRILHGSLIRDEGMIPRQLR